MEGEMKKKLLNKEDKPGGEVEVEEEGQQQIKEKVWGETKRLWIVAGPAIFTRFSTFGINIISQAFIGHIGPTELAAYALVITVLLRFANGILSVMESEWYKFSSFNLHFECVVGHGECLGNSMWTILWCKAVSNARHISSKIMASLGRNITLSSPSVHFHHPDFEGFRPGRGDCRSCWIRFSVANPGYVCLHCVLHLPILPTSAEQEHDNSLFGSISLTIHVFLSWLLVVKYQLGLPGALLSTVLAYWIPNIGQLMFILCGGCPETWKGFSSLAFKDLCL
ncbi:Protein detoxification 21 [Vitis vinifera]|uniref:Protein detoxification 21 n=1 Tax=Vitis vinifera TaxID=29760 RepID=A0A438FS21_VITVI|nr:Protein detoxification 21 [Vitis vinifera]